MLAYRTPSCRAERGHVSGCRAERERGSAFIAVLLVIIVLTMLGVALVLTTQSERQIGTNERTAQRNFYAADAGLNLGLTKFMVLRDYRPMRLSYVEPSEVDGVTRGVPIATTIETSAIYPINIGRSALGQINQGAVFFNINHAMSATATRTVAHKAGSEGSLVTTKQLSAMFMVDPLPQPNAQSLATVSKDQLSGKF